jgi:alkaline phosphatase D
MKIRNLLCYSIALIVIAACSSKKTSNKKFSEAVAPLYESSLKPFYHGVASGDPLQDRVIIWTRVTPEDSAATIQVRWDIASDENFSTILKSDSVTTDATKDYTVKVDVDGLQPAHHYYYRFHALGQTSPTGRTRTLSSDAVDSLRFAIVSCSNWEFGYFNPYSIICRQRGGCCYTPGRLYI